MFHLINYQPLSFFFKFLIFLLTISINQIRIFYVGCSFVIHFFNFQIFIIFHKLKSIIIKTLSVSIYQSPFQHLYLIEYWTSTKSFPWFSIQNRLSKCWICLLPTLNPFWASHQPVSGIYARICLLRKNIIVFYQWD